MQLRKQDGRHLRDRTSCQPALERRSSCGSQDSVNRIRNWATGRRSHATLWPISSLTFAGPIPPHEISSCEGVIASLFFLKRQLQCQLPETRIACTRCLSPGGRVDVSVHCRELSVVENIKKFRTELQGVSLKQRSVLQKRHVVVVESRSGKEAAASRSQLANCLGGESCCLEESMTG